MFSLVVKLYIFVIKKIFKAVKRLTPHSLRTLISQLIFIIREAWGIKELKRN